MASTPTIDRELETFFSGVLADPYPLYERLRSDSPVCRYGPDTVVVTRHATVKSIYRDATHFAQPGATRIIGDVEPLARFTSSELELYDELCDMQTLMMSRRNGADHKRYRAATNRAFVPRLIEELRELVERILDEVLEPLRDRPTPDVMELAYRVPLLVVTDLLGAPRADAEQIKSWGDALLTFSVRSPADGDELRAVHRKIVDYRAYARELIERNRRVDSHSGLSAMLLRSEAEGQLAYDELVATFMHFLPAAHETTTHLLGNGLRALLVHRTEWERLCADPLLARGAVEEALRYDPAVQSIVKYAAVDAEIDGAALAPGTIVVLSNGAANRDPAVFDEPARFDITRKSNDHFTFGYGTHFCLGAPLARLEGEIVFETLARRFPELQLAVDPEALEAFGGPHFRGLRELPVELGRQARG